MLHYLHLLCQGDLLVYHSFVARHGADYKKQSISIEQTSYFLLGNSYSIDKSTIWQQTRLSEINEERRL